MVRERQLIPSRALGVLSAALLSAALLVTPQVALADETTGDDQNQVVAEQVVATGDSGVLATEPLVTEDPIEQTDEATTIPSVTDTQDPVVVDTPAETVVEEDVTPADPVVTDGGSDEEAAVQDDAVETSDEALDADVTEDTTTEEAPAAGEAATEAVLDQQDDPDPYDGKTYFLESGTSDPLVVSTKDRKTETKTNVELAKYANVSTQKWTFVKDTLTGLYKVFLADTTMLLDVAGGKASAGANVRLYADTPKSGGNKAQLWSIKKNGLGVTLISALSDTLALGMKDGGKTAGTNMCLVSTSEAAATKRVFLVPTKQNITASKVIEDGLYTVTSNKDANYGLDLKGSSQDDKANLQLYKSNGSQAQKYYFQSDSNGFYTIYVISSGKVLDVAGANPMSGTNVRQYKSNGSDAQKWAVVKNSDGTFLLQNKATGLMLDIAGGKMANGSNVRGYRNNGSAAQKFQLTKTEFLPEGIYAIHALSKYSQVWDVKGSSADSGANIQLYKSNNSLAQRFQVVRVGANQYRIRTAASGGWATEKTGSAPYSIYQNGSSKTAASNTDMWRAVWNGTYFSLVSVNDNRYIDIDGTSNGADVRARKKAETESPYFIFVKADLIKAGMYTFQDQQKTMLEVKGNSWTAGANIQVGKANNDVNQKFNITKSGKGYKITGVSSELVIEVAGSSKSSGANVRQAKWTGGANQVWLAEIADGGRVRFVNKNSGKVLDLASNSTSAGVNVQQTTASSRHTEGWKLTKTKVDAGWHTMGGKLYFYYSGNNSQRAGTRKQFSSRVKSVWNKFKNYENYSSRRKDKKGSKYLLAIDNTGCYTYVFEGKKGAWEPLFDWRCSVGTTMESDPTYGNTAVGDFYIRKKGYKMGWYPYEYYWSEFYINSAAASESWGEGQRFHSTLKVGGPNSKDYENGGLLGYQMTHGCVRLLTANAKWIYDHCPLATRVISYR